jgi:predicted transcriptional regulator
MTSVRKQKTIKQINRKVILNLLRNSGEMSISDISKKISLSKPTLMKIMNHYMKKGLVIITGKGKSTYEGGKKPNIYKFNKYGGYAVGINISASRLFAVITNLKSEIVEPE